MSLVILSADGIYADCYFAADGEPSVPHRKVRKFADDNVSVVLGFVGSAGVGSHFARKLYREFERAPNLFLAALPDIWFDMASLLPEEHTKNTTLLLGVRAQEEHKQFILEGNGYCMDISDRPFYAIGYSPAVSFVHGYLAAVADGKTEQDMTQVITQCAKTIDFVDANQIFSEVYHD